LTSDALEMDPHKISTTSAAIDISKPSLPELDGGTLTEDKALAFLQYPDLPPEIIQKVAKNAEVMKSRKVRLAIAAHPRTARRLSLRLIRESHTGDLARFALLPAVAADLKKAAAELLLTRLPSITVGERISLARRSPAIVAAALLLDKEVRVWQAALDNPRLTEAAIVKVLHRPGASDALITFLCCSAKWSRRPEIRVALLLNEKTPLTHALAFFRTLPPEQSRDILHVSRLPRRVKAHLEETVLEKMP
jgi:hypothetical protein